MIRITLLVLLLLCILKNELTIAFNNLRIRPSFQLKSHQSTGISKFNINHDLCINGGRGLHMSAPTDGASDVFEKCRLKLKGTCVYFVGMMGCGKSTLGDSFAKKMGYRFLDTDEIAEYMIEMPIADYFAQGRVDEFRQLEYQILMEMSQYTRVVVSTGGGIVLRNDNWGMLRHGIVVYVDMDPEVIYDRLRADPAQIAKRPLLREADPLAKLKELSAERRDKYLQADVHVVVPKEPRTPEELAETTAQAILDFIADNPPLWESWKKKRDNFAVEAAGRFNPSATASADVGFGAEKKGSIKYVSMSDLQSGKVQIPKNSDDLEAISGSEIPPPFQ